MIAQADGGDPAGPLVLEHQEAVVVAVAKKMTPRKKQLASKIKKTP